MTIDTTYTICSIFRIHSNYIKPCIKILRFLIGIFEHVIDCNVKQVRSCTPVASPCRCDAPQVSHRCPPCVPQTYHCESDYFKELNAVRRDANLFPVKVDSYHKHAGLHDTSCVTCERQSRSRARTRSCSRASSRCSRSPSAYRYSMNMIKPKWNGGPFINNYLWRDEKLAENK